MIAGVELNTCDSVAEIGEFMLLNFNCGDSIPTIKNCLYIFYQKT